MIGNRAMKPMGKSGPSITGNTNINNNSIVHDAADSDLLLCTATAALRDRHPPVAANGGIRSQQQQQQQQQHQHHNEDRSVPKQQRFQPQAAETLRCLETRSVASQVRSAAPAPIVAWNGGLRANFTETPKETAASVDVTDGGGAVKLVPTAEIEVDDPYAELERILEKAQAEISEMFAQTVRAEKMKAVATSVPSPEPEDGSQVKRTSDSEQARRDDRGREVRREGSSGLQQQQQHHQEHASHHRKYATIPHASVATTPSRNAAFTRRTAEEGEAKRTRNTLDPRYRSTELEVVSSAATTGAAGGRGTTPAAASSASSLLLQTSSDSSNNGYGGRTELSDSLSDDMSLLDVGAPYTDGARDDCAGDDETTSDEMVMHSFKCHHQHPSGPAPGTTIPATTTTTPATVFRSSGFYRKHTDSPPSDRSMKTSTNSLPSMAGTAHRNLALHLKFKTHQSAIDAKRKQFFLALDQEPFQPLKSNMADLPSPSSTSLHSGHNHLIAEELGSKSSSAPVLLKDEENGLTVQRANLRYSRSQSDRHLAEIEAIEACRWLRAAGFPQYAQMYEDHQFPIDVENVEKDHPFLESDPLQSLFRRLHTLNRCANMHLDVHQHHHTPKPSQREDSDDDSCALSEAWTFQHNSRRWSRVDDAIGLVSVIANKQQKSSGPTKDAPTKGPTDSIDSATAASNGSRHSRAKHGGTALVRAEDHEKLWLEGGGKITIGVPSDTDSQDDSAGAVHLRRTGSERLKDGAKAILRRVESIKSRRRKKQYRDGLIILAPHANNHLSPHHHRGADGELIIGPDIMSYSNPTSPRPSAEMLQFDDGLAMMGRHKNLFSMEPASGDGQERNLLSPYMPNAANAWSPVTPLMQRGGSGGDRNTPNVLLPFQVQLQQQEARSGDDSSSICSEDSGGGPGVEFDSAPRHTGGGGSGRGEKLRSKYARTKKALRSKVIASTVDDYRDSCGGGTLSDSEYQSKQRRSKIKVELDRDTGASVTTSSGSPAGTAPKTNNTTNSTLAPPVTSSKLHRGGSLNLGKASKRYRDAFSNRSVRHSTKASNDEWGEGVGRGGSKRSTVARWHSFQQPKVSPIEVVQQQPAAAAPAPDHLLTVASIHPVKDGDAQRKQQHKQWQLVSSTNATGTTGSRPVEGAKQLPLDSAATGTAAGGARSSGPGLRMSEMSCGQLLVVRKLGLVKLTGYMERHCPTHRSGWNWDLPKFIKRIKTPDYKDRKVFGMPLVLNLQRYGSTVPYTIRMAFAWLERNALDQVGLFRKPGVKSRIAKLKSVIETSNDVGCRSELFDEYHAYDVADLLKQYFRELPDALLTAKLSETFIAIFQYLPAEVRAEAVQSAILLLPDEHREVLHLLLTFLDKVVQSSSLNQMTANNLAVCFAPSLFYLLTGNRYTTASPRRKKTGTGSGTPDERELSEAKASHECLAFMIDRFHSLWTITSDQMRWCNFNYMDESKPVPLASLGAEMHVQNWRGYLSECLNECLRQGRERPRGWVSLSSTDPSVTVFFKKVGDGHPLRLWKCVTEVEAPPMEVIQHIVNERPLWDAYLLKWRTIEQLDQDADVFQYACGQPITEYCVVRQWKNDLPRGACAIVELSISHENATPLLGGVAGVVLASRYLIEPCGSGKCKLMHLSRVDMKGRTPDWYNKNYGHICQQYLSKIKKFFEHCTEGPETKV